MFLKSFKAGPMNLDLVHTFLVRLPIRINSLNLLFNSCLVLSDPYLKPPYPTTLYLQSGKYCNSLQPDVYLQFVKKKKNCLGICASQPCGKTPENLDGETSVTNTPVCGFQHPSYLSDLSHNLIPFPDHPFQISE